MLRRISLGMRRYGIAGLTVAIAFFLKLLLDSFIPIESPFLLFFAAVMVSAWYGGRESGIFATVLAALLSNYFFLSPLYSLFSNNPGQNLRLVLFLLEGGLLSLIVASLHATKQRLEVSLLNLSASEERYRQIIETAYEGIWVIDADGRTEYVNQRLAQMLGYSIQEMLGRSLFDFMEPEAQEEAKRSREQRKQGLKEQFDFCYRRKDGSELWAIVSTNPINEQGEFSGAIAMLTDVTERRQDEVALRQSEERYRAFVKQSSEGIWRFELEPPLSIEAPEDEQIRHFYQYVYLAECNDVMAQMYGFDHAEEIIGARLDTFLVKSDPHNIEYLQNFIRSGYRLVDAESSEVDRYGNAKDFLNNLVGIVEDGFLVRVWGTQRDISEAKSELRLRKQAEVALQKSQERLALAQKAGKIGTYDWNIQTNEVAWTEELEAVYGLSPGNFGGKYENWVQTLHPDDRLQAEQKVQQAALEGTNFDIEFRILHPDSSLHWIAAKGRVFNDETGKPLRMIGVNMDVTEHRLAEAALKESERRFRRLVESNIFGVVFSDFNGGVQYANDYILKMLGYEREELLNGQLRWDQITPPEFSHLDVQGIEELKIKGVCTPFEKELICKDGTRVPILVGAALLQEPYDQQQEIIAFCLDLTERKQAEAERLQLISQLEAERSQLEAIIQSMPDAVLIGDATGIWKCNDRAIGLLGFDSPDQLKRNIALLGEQIQIRAYETGEPITSEDLIFTHALQGVAEVGEVLVRQVKSGRDLVIRCAAAPIWCNGEIIGAVMINSDITEHKCSEAALQESNQRLELLSETASSLLLHEQPKEFINGLFKKLSADLQLEVYLNYLFDKKSQRLQLHACGGIPDQIAAPIKVIELGEEICGTVAITQHSFIGEDIQASTDPSIDLIRSLGINAYACFPLLARGQLIGTLSFGSRNRQKFDADDLALMQVVSDQVAAALEHARLVAELQQQAEELTHANRMKDEFLATLSHELRTPLNSLLGWTHLLRSRRFDSATTVRALETLDRNTRVLGQLIEDVLDVSRIITGKLRLNVRACELAPVIETAIDTVLPAADAKNIRIETQLDTSLEPVLGDAARLQQIVWNLLSNAVKFTPNQGRIQVQLTTQNSQAQIKVSDTGKGISADFLPYVFERFRQGDGTITRSHGGLGLGLAIVRHLVELQGGTVYAESPGVGQGASFTVTLPLMRVSPEVSDSELIAATAEPERLFDCPPILNGLRVLVVDDEADARVLLTTILEEYGAEVTAVSTVRQALATVARLQPDVLVSDIGMPEEDGYTLIRQLRELDAQQGGTIPAVALTAYARAEDRTQSLLAGFQLHVPKPVDPRELAAVVANLAGRTRQG